ncbi:protein kinase family protein [Spirilliplanes yamanashiensis]|uniref:Protein kinase domain-containing protein n=1 Tax=Spirilliplanes yamanashiensis TaxID=42233 RepID=A0A8J3Y702_9ACTN|nr:protein kinase family protein [Spirilliplanes yamanashiensis]MDP9814933.1 hypothetical protein [Spirilliplanes yamanashiensis]GIJ02587.1 hypothetical protein Sya03_19390 [Spirilliplanes yamanashiensis]
MTQVGEGQETAADEAGPVMTFGAPTVGEVLAERYQLEEHVNDDSAGRQVWRGIDVILRRPVAVVLRYPGGDSATEMLQAAVAASRVIHPNLVGVYDAIDEEARAYVVREWVDGQSLREIVAGEGPLDPARATAIAHSITDALAAVHATGMVHGNVHPGTTLVGDDGRVVLADARADSSDSTESDARAVGGILYFALTGHWPHAEAGESGLPDAVRDGSGTIAAPRQARAGIPAYLDDLTMDLLDKRIAAPETAVLAAELARLDSQDEYEADAGPLRFVTGGGGDGESPRAARKIVLGIGALLVIAVIGLIFGIRAITTSSEQAQSGGNPTQQGAGQQQGGDPAAGGEGTDRAQPKKLALTGDMVRIVDPPTGDRSDVPEGPLVVDGEKDTGWDTQGFNQAKFHNKLGMGVLINLGEPRTLSEVRIDMSAPGAVMELRTGTGDPGNSSAGDDQVAKTFTPLADDGPKRAEGSRAVLGGFDPDTQYQYLLVWITELPQAEDGKYRITVEEIEVHGV